MIGNVWEWVQDCYRDGYAGVPADGSAWNGERCEARVMRGGSWNNNPQDARTAIRHWFAPADQNMIGGFRLARALP